VDEKQIRIRYSDGKDETFYNVVYISYAEPGFVILTDFDKDWYGGVKEEFHIPLSNIRFIVDETRD
jgi:hypothetical protein